MNDDDLLADVARVAAAVDGPPGWLREAVRDMFLTRDVDAELAVLTGDSRADGFETVRADAGQGQWLLSFSGGGIQVDMEVSEMAGRISLIGQVIGTAGNECLLETRAGQQRIEVDELGRFVVTGLPHGRLRLRCRSADGAPVTTVWVTV